MGNYIRFQENLLRKQFVIQTSITWTQSNTTMTKYILHWNTLYRGSQLFSLQTKNEVRALLECQIYQISTHSCSVFPINYLGLSGNLQVKFFCVTT